VQSTIFQKDVQLELQPHRLTQSRQNFFALLKRLILTVTGTADRCATFPKCSSNGSLVATKIRCSIGFKHIFAIDLSTLIHQQTFRFLLQYFAMETETLLEGRFKLARPARPAPLALLAHKAPKATPALLARPAPLAPKAPLAPLALLALLAHKAPKATPAPLARPVPKAPLARPVPKAPLARPAPLSRHALSR
jgi:hypothetical protein